MKAFNGIRKYGALLGTTIVCVLTMGFVVYDMPVSGAFTTDVTQYYTKNRSQNTLEQVNQILCVIGKTGYDQMNGQGNYVASVDTNTCNTSGGNTSSTSQVSGAPNLMTFAVNSTQPGGAGTPEIVQMWAQMPAQHGSPYPILIKGTLVVTSSPTTTNPYGVFNFNFAGYPVVDGVTSGTIAMSGYIKSVANSGGTSTLTFYQTEQGNKNAVTLVSNSGTSGYANAYELNNFGGGGNGGGNSNNVPNQYTVAYNENLAEVQHGSSSLCYSKTSFNNLVNSYGVYDNSGNAVSLNSGYPVKYNGMQSWMSYYGLTLPPGVTPTHGDAITKINSDNTQTAGTLFVRNGRMQQMNIKNLTLSQLAGTSFNVSTNFSGGNDVLTWDTTQNSGSGGFMKIGTQSCSPSSGCNQTNQTPVLLTQSQLEAYATAMCPSGGCGSNFRQQNIFLWINGLGGGGSTQLKVYNNQDSSSVVPTNATNLAVWTNSQVQPSSSGSLITLYCLQQCPIDTSGTTAMPEWDGTGNTSYTSNGKTVTAITYTFDPVNYTLTKNGGSPVFGTAVLESPANIFTGPLLTSSQITALTSASPDGLPHSFNIFNPNSNITSYYSYSASGSSNPWNRFVSIRINGQLQSFDAPLQLNYINPSGGKVFLQYMGFGNLQGIPGSCIDEEGNAVSCNNGGFNIWVPSYSIPDKSQLTDNSGNSYWVRWLQVGQSMNVLPLNSCSALSGGLTAASALSLDLTGAAWVDPSGIGDAPAIMSGNAPTFVNGIKQ